MPLLIEVAGIWATHDLDQTLAEKLLKIRQALGVSQSALVNRLGVELAPNNISKYEHNLNEPPTDVMLAYARLARVPLEQLVDDEMELG